MTTAGQEQLEAILSQKRNAVVATIKKDGSPQVTPVSFTWDGEVLRFSTTKGRAKYFNLRRDARVTVLIDSPQGYAVLYGRAEMDDNPQSILERIRAIRRKYQGDEKADALTWEELARDQRVLITLRPERILGL